MGEVYRASDPRLWRDVTIAVTPSRKHASGESAARLEREARLRAPPDHPGIATIHGAADSGGSLVIVMESARIGCEMPEV